MVRVGLRAFLNPAVRRDAEFRGLFTDHDYREVHTYFASHPELPPAPLRSLSGLAADLGVAKVDAKDETFRFGLNAFKIIGVRYAVHRLGDDAARRGLVCATAGNHGRAVARVARQKGVPCTVFIPTGGSPRIDAMRADGATVVEVQGTYEEAVRLAAEHGLATGATIVSDTSWQGYEEIPRWIMAGYTQIFEEAHAQWNSPPTVVLVQGGVGGLVCAAASWFAWRFAERRPYLIACEPESAACLMDSARAGAATLAQGDLSTIMACLRCAEPSAAAWPTIAAGIDAFMTVSDQEALQAVRILAAGDGPEHMHAGVSGACGLAALTALVSSSAFGDIRRASGLDRASRAFIIVSEGA
ncbi:MAG: pyridoxal-phosphate dependent enzyme [Vicinamibacterales bacterium]